MDALGLIEVVGLTAGIEAADVACKTADVKLVGYELAKGGGYVTIKVLGQVGAVTAAVDAAASAARAINTVVSALVIPRPANQIEPMVMSPATVGYQAPEPAEQPARAPEPAPVSESEAGTQSSAPAPEATQGSPARNVVPARETAEAQAGAVATPAKSTPRRK